mgnify:CR=1 FL=1
MAAALSESFANTPSPDEVRGAAEHIVRQLYDHGVDEEVLEYYGPFQSKDIDESMTLLAHYIAKAALFHGPGTMPKDEDEIEVLYERLLDVEYFLNDYVKERPLPTGRKDRSTFSGEDSMTIFRNYLISAAGGRREYPDYDRLIEMYEQLRKTQDPYDQSHQPF